MAEQDFSTIIDRGRRQEDYVRSLMHRPDPALQGGSPFGYSKVVNRIAEALTSVSKSEQELMAMLYGFDGQSRSLEEIARLLHIASKTVSVHSANIRKKLNLHSTAQLIRFAVQSEA